MEKLIRWFKKLLIAAILFLIGLILLFVTMGAMGRLNHFISDLKER